MSILQYFKQLQNWNRNEQNLEVEQFTYFGSTITNCMYERNKISGCGEALSEMWTCMRMKI